MSRVGRKVPSSPEGRAAVEMYITGLSEAEIYFLGHKYWERPLSYRGIRQAFKDARVPTRHRAALARRKGDTIRYGDNGSNPHWERVAGKYKYGGARVGHKSPYLNRRDANAVQAGDRRPWKERRLLSEQRILTARERLARQYFFSRSLNSGVRLRVSSDTDYYTLNYSVSGSPY